MDVAHAVRDAIERQVFDHEPGQAALVLRDAVGELGPEPVASALLDAAAVALRRMVAETDEAFDQNELLHRLAMDGAVPAENIEVLGHMLTLAAATAGGIRPPVDIPIQALGAERALFGAWLAALSAIRIVAIYLERTETEIADDIVTALQ